MGILWDQSAFIRESINDVQYTMIFTIILVVAVMFLFVRAFKATIIPSLVVPMSLIAVFPLMSILGYSLNNLSLMALTLSIGFVIDDAVVVMENIIRRTESGEMPMEASIRGSREIGFTVLSMTLSLAVVFIPIMFMGGIMGRLFREFAVCIAAAIIISGFLSLTFTPMLCSRLLAGHKETPAEQGKIGRILENAFESARRFYGWSLRKIMRLRLLALIFTGIIVAATAVLFNALPKGFIPNQDQNIFRIFTQAHERTSYEAMCKYQNAVVDVLSKDPDCAAGSFISVPGFPSDNNGLTFISLIPPGERQSSVDEIINRLRPKISQIQGITASLVNPPLITIGSRFASAQWQFTLQSTDVGDLYRYGAALEGKIRDVSYLTDVKSDIQMRKPKLEIEVDRDKASSLGLTLNQVQDAFYSAFGDRQISTIYSSSNFYYVILEVDPSFRKYPSSLNEIYVRSSNNSLVPLDTVARIKETVAPLAVNHSGQLPSATISFNLKPGASIGSAMEEVNRIAREILPANISTAFQGSAQAFKASFASMGFLLIITVIIIYLTLGILYESFIHPLTILTSLPLAGFGALIALYVLGLELDMYAYVGIIMLIGIVKKNGIMMVDFALEAERTRGLDSEESIVEACLTRFRPIMMTTMAALFGALPIAIGLGAGGDARRPLGVAVVGGLLFSQLLTLYITPVFYVYMDRLNRFLARRKARKFKTVAG
jgi:HAE1 family hydrophobic/amphiphilic exporter-1